MAKVVDITEKLTFDGNPRLGIMGKELEVRADAEGYGTDGAGISWYRRNIGDIQSPFSGGIQKNTGGAETGI